MKCFLWKNFQVNIFFKEMNWETEPGPQENYYIQSGILEIFSYNKTLEFIEDPTYFSGCLKMFVIV